MAPLRSLGNIISSFNDFYARTGTDAIGAPPDGTAPISVTGGNANYVYNGKKIHVWTSPGPFVLTGGPGPVEYFVVAGGGAGGADMGGGGGGGGVLTGELTLSGPFSTSVTVGPGGTASARGSGTPDDAKGDPSILNNPVSTVTALGGGFGQGDTDPDSDFAAETNIGSGGGGYGQGDPNAGGPAPTYPGPVATQQGTPGYETAPPNYGGGGGGAGRTAPPNGFGASQQDGGYGIAIPTTFRDPSNLYGGPNGPDQPNLGQPGKWYFAGGGCGGNPNNGNAYGGGSTVANNAVANKGGGAGGGPGSGGDPGGNGGSGIVFIAYTTS